ncbi:hypothetical protein L9F63_018840 [Diploptera punctata]|uniref:EB domain-containing protein n=1 Tax=Diploptera punctata TaxID=6984 RepID=A0AAD7ZX33_DIPPU|nr:hypothetical protein L9F63_018840 [Diploptera punctata]
MRQLCNYDTDCIENAFCRDQTYCQCKAEFLLHLNGTNNFLCLKEATNLDDSCIEDIQCTKPFGSHATCTVTIGGYKACSCVSGAHFTEGRCYQTSRIGERCVVHNNCQLDSGLRAYCDRSICNCPNNYHPDASGKDCIRTSYLDDPCTSDQECITENSRCGEVCRCKIEYIQSHQRNACLRAADNMGDPCEETEQCTRFLDRARCDTDGTCNCVAGFHYFTPQNKCYRDIFLGEMCEGNEECIPQFSECKNGVCHCKEGYQEGQNITYCITAKNIGSKGQIGNKYILHLLLCLPFLLRT